MTSFQVFTSKKAVLVAGKGCASHRHKRGAGPGLTPGACSPLTPFQGCGMKSSHKAFSCSLCFFQGVPIMVAAARSRFK